SLIYDLQFYKNMGRCLVLRQEWSLAEECYRQALEAVQELAAGFANESDRERFLSRQTAFFTDLPITFPEDHRARIQECHEAIRNAPAQTDPASSKGYQRRQRIFHRVGHILTLVNVLLGIGAVLLTSQDHPLGEARRPLP